ncbi:MAG: DNA polymerase, partial [Candidatus Omnitrophica bacterium]|nr:DNA polymerase [Candidatus Omnitrophota bacterium]
FGITYGLTSFGLARDIGVSFDDAQAIIDTYFTRYPKVKDYIQEQIHKAEKDGFVTTILGRRRYIPDIGSKNQGVRQLAQRQAVNTPIQGSASDLIKAAMVKINEEFKKRKIQTEMILQIHDELLFNVPKRELKSIVSLVKEIMEHVWSLDVPIKIDIEAGKNWLEMEKVSV